MGRPSAGEELGRRVWAGKKESEPWATPGFVGLTGLGRSGWAGAGLSLVLGLFSISLFLILKQTKHN